MLKSYSKNHVRLGVVIKPAFNQAGEAQLGALRAQIGAIDGIVDVSAAQLIRGTKLTHATTAQPEAGAEPNHGVIRRQAPEPRDYYYYFALRMADGFYGSDKNRIPGVVEQLSRLDAVERVDGPGFFDVEMRPR